MLLVGSQRLRQVGAVLETANLLFFKLLLKKPENLRWYPGRVFRSYMRLVGDERWRSVGISELAAGPEPLRLTVEFRPEDTVGNRLDWLTYLCFLTRAVDPQVVFEIGSFRGRTALNFALNTRDAAHVYSLDLPPDLRGTVAERSVAGDARMVEASDPGREWRGRGLEQKITQLYGDSTRFDFSPYYGRVDLVFVDGGHDYRTAKSDTEQALKLRSPRGVIVWDNFAQYGEYNDVTRAVLDCLPGQEIMQVEDTELAVYWPRGQ